MRTYLHVLIGKSNFEMFDYVAIDKMSPAYIHVHYFFLIYVCVMNIHF